MIKTVAEQWKQIESVLSEGGMPIRIITNSRIAFYMGFRVAMETMATIADEIEDDNKGVYEMDKLFQECIEFFNNLKEAKEVFKNG